MDQSAAELVGAVFNGRWKLTRLLGEGGMGAVYEADGMRGEGKRALKVLHPEFIHEPEILTRFLAEAASAQKLEHPNVARVFEHATAEDGTPYLVMELLVGMPLSHYLDQGNPIAVTQAAPIFEGMLSALTLAHQRGIVHRDLKPDNLYVVNDGRGGNAVKVLDFGIAKVMDAAGGMGHKTRTGVLLGTPGYMSPEQIKNSKGVDPRSDLWSVGIIMYEMFTAKEPFPADNEFAKLTVVLTEPVKPIEEVAPNLAIWGGFFQKALAKEPGQRFQTADEMLRALRGVLAQLGVAPTAAAGAPSVAAPSAAMPSAAMPSAAMPAAAMPASMGAASMGAASMGAVPSHPMAGYPTSGSAPPTAMGVPMPASMQLDGVARNQPATHISAIRPAGVPTIQTGAPAVSIVDAPRLPGGAPWWLVGVIGVVCLTIGFALGALVAG